MLAQLLNKEEKLAVLGLGYVGLPIALEFARTMKVIGFEIRQDRVELMKKGIDPSKELEAGAFDGADIEFTTSLDKLREAKFFIIAVPTPINDYNMPDLEPVIKASETVAKVLKKGDYVVYESTVYPGCTEEDCVPVLEKISGLTYRSDFKVGYSPERINPGDQEHTLTRITKVTSGCDEESAGVVADVYASIIKAGIHKASSIKVAEAAKIIENTQRDINIAFMNELSIIFNRMNINTYEVLEAAGTKWNFLKFFPGLVGGHCIGVDPYYLSFKARKLGYHAQIINSGRFINDSMGGYIAKQVIKKMISANKVLNNARVLVMGITFKENVSDIRNSRVIDVVKELKSYGVSVEITDPYASPEEVEHEYGISLIPEPGKNYDAIVLAVNHREYVSLDDDYFLDRMNPPAVFFDVKGVFRGRMKGIIYSSL